MLHKNSTLSRSSRFFQMTVLASATLTMIACSSDDSSDNTVENTDDPVVEQPNDNPSPPTTSATPAPSETRSTSIGDVFVYGAANRTLYTFANDDTGGSNCNGGCAVTWPPIVADSEQEDGAFSTIQRNDDSLQWAFKGAPLYYYEGDAAEGEINGEGLGNVWFVARPDPVETRTIGIGEVLAGLGSTKTGESDAAVRNEFNGRTLYVFANDEPDVSNCNEGCATNWPPLYADFGAQSDGKLTVIERSDGTRQWSYESQPLYFYSGDSAAGDTNGEGLGNVWTVAKP